MTGVQTCALPISTGHRRQGRRAAGLKTVPVLPVEGAELVVRQAKQLGGVALMMASLGQAGVRGLSRPLFLAGILIRFSVFGFFCLTLWSNSFSNAGHLSGSETVGGAASC